MLLSERMAFELEGANIYNSKWQNESNEVYKQGTHFTYIP